MSHLSSNINVVSLENRLQVISIEDEDWEYIKVLDEESSDHGKGESLVDKASDYGDDSLLAFHVLDPSVTTPEIKYAILSKAEVLQCLEDKLSRVTTVLSLSRSEAATVLHHFKWSVMWAAEEWLTSDTKVREAVGLFQKPIIMTPLTGETACRSCHEKYQGEDKMMLGVSCGHKFCRSCWEGYISEAVGKGPGCLGLRCLEPSCAASVGLDLIEWLSSEEDKKKVEHYLIRSCLTDRREVKWCPVPGCEYAVVLTAGGDDSNVTCRCSYMFCWNCTKEAHAPVDCCTAGKWMSEINVQSENWLLANTKPCPMCGCSIEDYEGCKYLTCTFCNYEFCCTCGRKWPELVPWDDYAYNCPHENSKPTEYHVKNKYERDIVKSSLKKFNCIYDGWIFNESSRGNTLTDLKLFQGIQLQIMGGNLGLTEDDLKFIVDAQIQIAECYQILKWTCVYGYFMSEQEEKVKESLFHFTQEQAKGLVRSLETQVRELELFINPDAGLSQFVNFRQKLLLLTRATKNHFDKMVEALKAGLPEVVSSPKRRLEQLPNSMDLGEGWSGDTSSNSKT